MKISKGTVTIMGMDGLLRIVACFYLVFTLASCAGTARKKIAVAGDTGQEDRVLATVGGKPVTESDFNRALERVPAAYRDKYLSADGKKQLVRSLIEDELFYQEGRRLGIDSARNVKAEVEDFRKRIIRERVSDELKKKVVVKDSDIERYYRDNQEKYTVPEKLRLGVIMIGLSKDAAPEEVEKAEEKAMNIIERLSAGEEFEWLARQLSGHSSGKDGGDLGFLAVEDIPADIAVEASAIPVVGEVSGPVRGELGIYIVRLTGKQPESTVAFEEAGGDIERALFKKAHDDAYKELLENLEDEFDIEIDEAAMNRIGVKTIKK
ncbi:MAG: peptidylprolyl isomerase [Candidatus Tritonobacter lacicola]|nr:peptidylprolyl isomerase [Candidatus Tritonobacter lacicola]